MNMDLLYMTLEMVGTTISICIIHPVIVMPNHTHAVCIDDLSVGRGQV